MEVSSDGYLVSRERPGRDQKRRMPMPWILKLSALSVQESTRLLHFLSGTVLGCGGRVLSRSCCDREVLMSFEFERSGCVEMYTALVGAGLELSQHSHRRLTELCHCTRFQGPFVAGETVAVELEVMAHTAKRPGITEAEATPMEGVKAR
jgi:hypothetical protein